MRGSQRAEIVGPRRYSEGDERAQLRGHLRRDPPTLGELGGEEGGDGAVAPHLGHVENTRLAVEPRRQRLDDLPLAAAADDQIEVVGPDAASPEELD